MEFDKSRVYTALNADKLKVGSKVIVGDTVEALRNRVQNGTTSLTLSEIRSDYYGKRFRVEEYTEPESVYYFAYLILEPEETWIVYLCRGPSNPEDYYLTACRSDLWERVQEDCGAKTKLFEGTENEVDEWYVPRRHLANVIAAWEDGKTIQCFITNTETWEDLKQPSFEPGLKYRIKPEGLKWTDLKMGDIIRKKYEDGYRSATVIRIDTYSTERHIGLGGEWLTDDDLEDWEKVE